MSKYIKSHSNYVINKKHQITNEGTIYERDITTIGGRDQFAPGQIPIYRSDNFVITTNGEIQNTYKTDVNKSWKSNNGDFNDIWTLNSIKKDEMDETSSNDNDIVIKQDIYNLTDFAYWGSCSELFRTSIGDILNRYPGEFYLPYNNITAYTRNWSYRGSFTPSGDEIAFCPDNGKWYNLETGEAYDRIIPLGVPVSGSEIFYSVDEIKNNGPISACVKSDGTIDTSRSFIISGRTVQLDDVVLSLPNVTYRFNIPNDTVVGITPYYNKYDNPQPFKLYIYRFGHLIEYVDCYRFIDNNGEFVYYRVDNLQKYDSKGQTPIEIEKTIYSLDNPLKLDMLRIVETDESLNPLKYLRANDNYKNYELIYEDGETYDITINVNFLSSYIGDVKLFKSSPIPPTEINLSNIGTNNESLLGVDISAEFNAFGEWSPNHTYCPGELLAVIDLNAYKRFFDTNLTNLDSSVTNYNLLPSNNNSVSLTEVTRSEEIIPTSTYKIYAFIGDDGQIVYTVDFTESSGLLGAHIRPKKEYITSFYKSLDTFENLLVNPLSTPIHTAQFNIIDEDDYGYYTHNELLTFPTTNGGYNLSVDGPAYNLYLNRLMEIGEFYDERFTDNIWRAMTHEAMKNLDWSQTKNDDDFNSKGYEDGFGKMAKTIRVMGRFFDSLKIYVDSLKETNSLSYSEGAKQLPDYFISDKLEEFGWNIAQVQPYKLTIYSSYDKNPFQYGEPKIEDEKTNTINGYSLIRKFYIDNTKETIKPYRITDEDGNDRTLVPSYDCAGAEIIWDKRDIVTDPDSGLFVRAIKKYGSNIEYTYPEINTEFFRRLTLNSKNILRKKGTIAGIESILSMFGMRSKDFAKKSGNKILGEDGTLKLDYDYEIKEHVIVVDSPIIDDKDYVTGADYQYDNINTMKDIVYNNDDFINGRMEPYEGLPVIYYENEEEHKRYLYPNFDSFVQYDGNPYYQMKGGWMKKSPYMFDVNDNIVNNSKINNIYTETSKDIRTVENIEELIAIPYYELSDGDIIRVKNTSGLYVIVDGTCYELIEDHSDVTVKYYFSVTVDGSIVTIGNTYFEDTITVSDFNGNKKKYVLTNDVMNGKDIRIYVDIYKTENIMAAYSNTQSVSIITLYDSSINDPLLTDYFIIRNAYSAGEISENGWRRIKTTDDEYFIVNNLRNNYEGNNPHKGNMNYDSGEEYFSYFTKLFKYAIEDNHFSNRLYEVYEEDTDSIIESFGFTISGSDNTNQCGFAYGNSLKDGNGYVKGTNGQEYNNLYFNKHKILIECDKHPLRMLVDPDTGKYCYGDEPELYDGVCKKENVKEYISDKSTLDTYGLFGDRVINTKVIDIIFRLNAKFPQYITYDSQGRKEVLNNSDYPYTVDGQCMIKYIEECIMPYLSEMIPSSTICRIFYSQDYFAMVVSAGGNIKWNGSSTSNTLLYSKDDGETWEIADRNTTISVNVGDRILWKGKTTPFDDTGIGHFSGDDNVKYSIEGNIMSLLFGDDFDGQRSLEGKDYAFLGLFTGNTNITSAERLSLPAITLSDSCYQEMFSGCINLTVAPKLPATALVQYCYNGMFFECTSLTTAPELPAITLAVSCYYSMFNGCSSLTTAPELPATTLADFCYNSMFQRCTNLTTAPELPATTLAQSCYSYMFYSCRNLTTAPELPATTLANSCYSYMFDGCTSLTTAPELPATTLAQSCYAHMFDGCASLNSIKCLATDLSAGNCTTNWVAGVASSGTFTKSASMAIWKRGVNGVPSGWTIVDG